MPWNRIGRRAPANGPWKYAVDTEVTGKKDLRSLNKVHNSLVICFYKSSGPEGRLYPNPRILEQWAAFELAMSYNL